MTERLTWYRTDAHRHKGRKWHRLPNDSARVAWDVLMAEAKLHTADGTFDNESHLRTCLGVYARYVRALREAGILDGDDGLHVHDWDEWQTETVHPPLSPAADRQRRKRAREKRDMERDMSQEKRDENRDEKRDTRPRTRERPGQTTEKETSKEKREPEARVWWAHYLEVFPAKSQHRFATYADLIGTRTAALGLDRCLAALDGVRFDTWEGRASNVEPKDLLKPSNVDRFADWALNASTRPTSNGHVAVTVEGVNAHRNAVLAGESR